MDDVLRLGAELHLGGNTNEGAKANTLSALSMAVDPDWRNKGIAGLLLQALKRAALRAGLSGLVVPARPTWKHQYPDVDIGTFLLWDMNGTPQASFPEEGSGKKPFDPWLRRHVSLGARMAKVAPLSMTVEADAATWMRWLGVGVFEKGLKEAIIEIDESGQEFRLLKIPHGLERLRYSPSSGVARYVEPNVWMEYSLS
ncbi:nitrogen assimilation transcription factor nirA [Purpureocillium lavendulum]|uniref:Nitrogen assimilation transcription factor nirA n=1 Tax=Purpureocillium lavendulum TaxID=1247861 RepID=A0AB34FMW9_9HYPO|nr:nitrogen assimilation transcription factor nirA [Purpureocillium lavendulum]